MSARGFRHGDFSEAWGSFAAAPRRCLELAYESLAAGGLAVGAALIDERGAIVAEGRNRAYDPRGGTDVLQGNVLAHAELNVLALVQTDRDLGECVLWSTHEPCSMCSAAAAFTGVGALRHVAPDPWAIAARAVDPTVEASKALVSAGPEANEWLVTANLFFLLGVASKRGVEASVVTHNLEHEPETAGMVVDLVKSGATAEIWASRPIEEALADSWARIVAASRERHARVGL